METPMGKPGTLKCLVEGEGCLAFVCAGGLGFGPATMKNGSRGDGRGADPAGSTQRAEKLPDVNGHPLANCTIVANCEGSGGRGRHSLHIPPHCDQIHVKISD